MPIITPAPVAKAVPLVASAITTRPATYSATPTSMMRSAPNLSARAPAKGWLAPHIRFCSASAKAKVSRFQPWAWVIGRLNRPKPCRMPIESVTSRPPHTSTVVRESCRFCMSWLGVRRPRRVKRRRQDCLCLLFYRAGTAIRLAGAGWWGVYSASGKRVRRCPQPRRPGKKCRRPGKPDRPGPRGRCAFSAGLASRASITMQCPVPRRVHSCAPRGSRTITFVATPWRAKPVSTANLPSGS